MTLISTLMIATNISAVKHLHHSNPYLRLGLIAGHFCGIYFGKHLILLCSDFQPKVANKFLFAAATIMPFKNKQTNVFSFITLY